MGWTSQLLSTLLPYQLSSSLGIGVYAASLAGSDLVSKSGRTFLLDMAPSLLARQSFAPFRAVTMWSLQAQNHFATVANSDGDFNGTCAISEENIPLLVNENMCASW